VRARISALSAAMVMGRPRMVRDSIRSEMASYLTDQRRMGGMLNPVASL
jgi:hypothetical protein